MNFEKEEDIGTIFSLSLLQFLKKKVKFIFTCEADR